MRGLPADRRRRFSEKEFEVADKVGLVRIAEFVGDLSQLSIWFRVDRIECALKSNDSSEALGGDTDHFVKAPLDLALTQ